RRRISTRPGWLGWTSPAERSATSRSTRRSSPPAPTSPYAWRTSHWRPDRRSRSSSVRSPTPRSETGSDARPDRRARRPTRAARALGRRRPRSRAGGRGRADAAARGRRRRPVGRERLPARAGTGRAGDRHARGRESPREQRAVSRGVDPQAVAQEPAPPAGVLLAPERSLLTGRSAPLVIGSAGDRLEREAERVASALVQRRAPIPRTSADAVVLRRQGPPAAGQRAEPGSSGSIRTGKLARREYVVHPHH